MCILSPMRFNCPLELADLSFADVAGMVLLKELRSRGVGLLRTNPFMAEHLKDGASSDDI